MSKTSPRTVSPRSLLYPAPMGKVLLFTRAKTLEQLYPTWSPGICLHVIKLEQAPTDLPSTIPIGGVCAVRGRCGTHAGCFVLAYNGQLYSVPGNLRQFVFYENKDYSKLTFTGKSIK